LAAAAMMDASAVFIFIFIFLFFLEGLPLLVGGRRVYILGLFFGARSIHSIGLASLGWNAGYDKSENALQLQHTLAAQLVLFWKIKIPSKIHIFAWRLAHNFLPTRQVLKERSVSEHGGCNICGADVDS